MKVHREVPRGDGDIGQSSYCGLFSVVLDRGIIVTPCMFGWLPRQAQCGNCLRTQVFSIDGLPNGQQSARDEHVIGIETALHLIARVFALECAEWRTANEQWREKVIAEYDRQMGPP